MDSARDPKSFTNRFELDYFRRARAMRRWKWSLSLAAMLICGLAMATLMAAPALHSVFQAAPVSHAHAAFGANCSACHDQPFGTLSRILPGSKVGTVSDGKCLTCHDAGRHAEHQLHNTAADGKKSSGCIECHKEHRGNELSKLSDVACTNCHASLKTKAGTASYHATIHHFADDHPAFGAWRKQPLTDPAGGKFEFNHQRHLALITELKDVSIETRPQLMKEVTELAKQSCAYCHQADADMKRMQPIRYDAHCAKCHPLNVQAMPVAHWPDDVAKAFAQYPLPHPGVGEGPAKIRATLLQRYLSLTDQVKPAAAPSTEPPILRSNTDPKEVQERERLATERTRQTEAQLFNRPGVGCSLCHKEINRVDGLPEFAKPHQQRGRWYDELGNWPVKRFQSGVYADAANRWHPHATFNHAMHRTIACTHCHAAVASTKTEDVLIPARETCVQCHNKSATSARSECLTCHSYHDRSQEQPVRTVTPELLQRAKP